MAIGSYGTIRPSDVSPQDVEIIMNYTPTRDVTDQFVLTQLDAQSPWLDHLTQDVFPSGVSVQNFAWNFSPNYRHWLQAGWVRP